MLENIESNPLFLKNEANTFVRDLEAPVFVKVTSKKPAGCKCCGNELLNELCQKDGYDFWECEECGFVFTDIAHEEMLKSYESVNNNENNGAAKDSWPKSIEFLSPALSWLPDKELKIMDFGCGECTIPDRLRKEGHRVIAVDLLPPAQHHADRLTGDILDLDIPANSFDLIYSYQAFEHLIEPRHVLKRLCRLLKEDGMLLIHTDMETPERYSGEFQNWWYVDPPGHCSFFKHQTFERMFEEFGCRIIYKNSKVVMATK